MIILIMKIIVKEVAQVIGIWEDMEGKNSIEARGEKFILIDFYIF
jgi:hypothetical protein